MSRMLDNLARVDQGEAPPPTPKLALVRTDLAPRVKARKIQPLIFVTGFFAVAALAFLIEGGYLQRKPEAMPVIPVPGAPSGINSLKAGQFAEAQRFFEESTRAQPRSASAWINLGFALKKLGQKKEAEKAYLTALTLEPNNIYALNNLGALLLSAGREPEAEKMLQRAVGIAPSYADARLNLAATYEQSGKWTEAFNAYQAFLDLGTGNAAVIAAVKERIRKVRSLATAVQSEEKF